MDSDVAPERGLSSSMDLYSHEGEGEGGKDEHLHRGSQE